MRRLSLNRSEPAKKSGQNIPKNRCRTTVAERMGGNASGTALYRGSGRLLKPRPGRPCFTSGRDAGFRASNIADLDGVTLQRLAVALHPVLMFAFKGPDANIRFRGSGRGSAHRCARPETGPEDAG